MADMIWADYVAIILLIVGGIAWGLYAFNFELVTYLLGAWARIVYLLVGVAGVYSIVRLPAIFD